MNRLLLFLLLHSSLSLLLVHSQTTFPNIGYLGTGYDYVYGNPHSPIAGCDPGYRQSVVDTGNYDQGLTTEDQRYYIPDGTEVRSTSDCSTASSVVDVYGTQTYTSSLENDVSFQSSAMVWGLGGSFSSSSSYKQVETSTLINQNVATEAVMRCGVYIAELQAFNPPNLTSNFQNAIESINPDPSSPNNQKTLSHVVDAFGTHVVVKVKMGGILGQRSEFTNTTWISFQENDVSTSQSADASLKIASGASSSLTSSQQSQGESYSNAATLQVLWHCGGTYPSDGSLAEWEANCQDTPFPMDTLLLPLTDFVTSQFFPDDPSIAQRQEILANYLLGYCAQLEDENKTDTCSNGTDISPPKVPSYTCALCESCGGHWPYEVGKETHDGDYGSAVMFGQQCSGTLISTISVGPSFCCTGPQGHEPCRLCAEQCGGNWPVETGRRLNQKDYDSFEIFFDSCAGAYTNSFDEFALCCQDLNQCRLCSDGCGDGFLEVGKIEFDKDYGPWEMFPFTSCTPGASTGYGEIWPSEPFWCCPNPS